MGAEKCGAGRITGYDISFYLATPPRMWLPCGPQEFPLILTESPAHVKSARVDDISAFMGMHFFRVETNFEHGGNQGFS